MMNFKLISFIILMLICSCIALADQKVVNSEDDFKAGSFSSMQLNLNPSHACDTSRYTSAGYDYPDTNTNPTGTCNRCDGSGNIQFILSDLDTFNECGTTNCLTGTCNGAGACGYYTSGQHNCATGYECDGAGNCISPWTYSSSCWVHVYKEDIYKSWNSAKQTCIDLGGYLPGKTQLQCIYDSGQHGLIPQRKYWSSTEYGAPGGTDALGLYYNLWYNYPKNNYLYVRCIS